MRKALAVIRTLFLLFIVGLTVRAMPWYAAMPKTHDESFARCSTDLETMIRAAWIAVAWIALETVVGWVLALRGPRRKAPPEAAASHAP